MELLKDLVLKCRSYRRFYQEVPVDNKTLRELVDLARVSASAVNKQPLKYVLSSSAEQNAVIFSCLHWAGTLKTWPGPAEGERPAAYIIILRDGSIAEKVQVDHGIDAWSILLGAAEKGLGGCMLGAVDKEKLRELLKLPNKYEILLVVALGKPKEKVILEAMKKDDSFDYWRDENQGHHVPKRQLDDIIVAEY
jgi:nitroreductase